MKRIKLGYDKDIWMFYFYLNVFPCVRSRGQQWRIFAHYGQYYEEYDNDH